jgi:hypothetical protein
MKPPGVTALLQIQLEQREIEARLRRLDQGLKGLGRKYAKVGRYLRARRAANVRAA